MRVALRRAAHQIFDSPKILDDPLALRIIGDEEARKLKATAAMEQNRVSRAFRAFMAVRSRYAEDQLARAVSRGAMQYVVLGAGLDTFAYRNPFPEGNLRVFEVDHPATQEWKREKLAAAAIAIPATLSFAPVDFERQTLEEGLEAAGFDLRKPAFFSWLGVTMYLTEGAVMKTLDFVASLPRGGGIAFDYAVPKHALGFLGRLAFEAISNRVAGAGEPFRTFFEPRTLVTKLSEIGFQSIEDLGTEELNARYFGGRRDGLRVGGSLARLIGAEV